MSESSHGVLITFLIIVGAIIIVLLARPRFMGRQYGSYSRMPIFQAATIPSGSAMYYTSQPDLIKTYGHPVTVYDSSPNTYTTTTYNTYTTTAPSQYTYPYSQYAADYTNYYPQYTDQYNNGYYYNNNYTYNNGCTYNAYTGGYYCQ